MSLHRNTQFYGEQLGSDYHRLTGKRCYAGDVDMIDYTYRDGEIKPVALVDYKYPGQVVGYPPSLAFYRYLGTQLNLPFFLVLTYLGEEHPVKCYYLLPGNTAASQYMVRCHLEKAPGAWLSLKAFSKFSHALRNLSWDASEKLPDGRQLKDLSNEVFPYPLPTINL